VSPPSALVLVHGTHGLNDGWWHAGSPFTKAVWTAGLALLDEVDPFRWSGELAGVPTLTPDDPADAYDDKGLAVWSTAGLALLWYCRSKTVDRVSLVTHSHGAQVAWFALAHGLLVDRWLDISGPVRRDMQRVRRRGMGNVALAVHVYDPTDPILLAGELGDGRAGLALSAPEYHRGLMVAGAGHSGLFNEHLAGWSALWRYLKDPLPLGQVAVGGVSG